MRRVTLEFRRWFPQARATEISRDFVDDLPLESCSFEALVSGADLELFAVRPNRRDKPRTRRMQELRTAIIRNGGGTAHAANWSGIARGFFGLRYSKKMLTDSKQTIFADLALGPPPEPGRA